MFSVLVQYVVATYFLGSVVPYAIAFWNKKGVTFNTVTSDHNQLCACGHMYEIICMYLVSKLSTVAPFSALSLCGLAGIAETLQSRVLQRHFNLSLSVALSSTPQASMSLLTVSFHRNFSLPLGRFHSIFISRTALMFSVSYFLLTCPNHFNNLPLVTILASSRFYSFLRCSHTLSPIAHRTILASSRFYSFLRCSHTLSPIAHRTTLASSRFYSFLRCSHTLSPIAHRTTLASSRFYSFLRCSHTLSPSAHRTILASSRFYSFLRCSHTLSPIAHRTTLASSRFYSFLRCSHTLSPIAHRTIVIVVVSIRFFFIFY